jgi:hypothetical protein
LVLGGINIGISAIMALFFERIEDIAGKWDKINKMIEKCAACEIKITK